MTERDKFEKLDHIPDSNKMMKYKGWPIVDVMPEGWVIDKTAGSPLSGHDFITNGKSVLNGQMRALLRVKSLPSGISQLTKPKPMVISEPTKHIDQVIDRDYVKTVNDLARAKFKKKMLSDILCDMQICEIEGWCKLDYLNEIRELINNLCADAVVSELKKSEAAVPQWIPVSERLPPVGDRCLFYRPLAEKSGDKVIAVKTAMADGQFCWTNTIPDGAVQCNPSDGACHVTHWMPLPAAPEQPE